MVEQLTPDEKSNSDEPTYNPELDIQGDAEFGISYEPLMLEVWELVANVLFVVAIALGGASFIPLAVGNARLAIAMLVMGQVAAVSSVGILKALLIKLDW